MKQLFYLSIVLTLLISCKNDPKNTQNTTSDQDLEVTETSNSNYDGTKYLGVKSGIVKYKISVEGNILGSKTNTNGTATYSFKNWGASEREERQTTETLNGETSTTKELSITKNGMIYDIDYDTHEILKMKDTRLLMGQENGAKNYVELGEKMMIDMGGKKTGTEKIKGYKCDIWEFMGTKTWIHKGIPLKTETKMMGVTRIEKATSIKFNTRVSNDLFDLPDSENFRVIEQAISLDDMPNVEEMKEQVEMMKAMQNIQNLSFKEWKATVAKQEEFKNLSDKELKEAYRSIKQMFGGN